MEPPATRTEFTVAIICALPIEADPVIALFDQNYDDDGFIYGKHPLDFNAYTTGRIGHHHVVVVHMPGIGKAIAASVAMGLKASFEGITIALVVGICGAMPISTSKAEIILGDVIISSSVVEFDFGRQFPDRFEIKRGIENTLGRPNQSIRAVLSKLQSRNDRKILGSKIGTNLVYLQANPELAANYPGVAQDKLFAPSHRHKHYLPGLAESCLCSQCDSREDPVCKDASTSNCEELGCDASETAGNLIHRFRLDNDSPKPVVHVGTIGSSSTVMKSGQHRDVIAQQNDIIAFEMEGAGVWDNLPCIIIKGVCDYADSHKNKDWQDYAAASAASGARAFLDYWTPSSQEFDILDDRAKKRRHPATDGDEPPNRARRLAASSTLNSHASTRDSNSLSGSSSASQDFNALRTGPRLDRTRQEQSARLEALKFDQIDSRHATIKVAHTDTCRWLLDKSEYLDWCNYSKILEHHGFLWIKGKPGTGKSTIMKFALASARKNMAGKIILSFFYNARGEELERCTEGMYRSLLFQLLKQIPELHSCLDNLGPVASSESSTDQWNIETLQTAFLQAICGLGQHSVTCFIDALDECKEDQVRDMIDFFEDLGRLAVSSNTQVQICFSSRHYPHITIEKSVQMVLEDQNGHTSDIAEYVRSKLKGGNSKRLQRIQEEIQERSSGIFLWVVLVIPLLNKAFDSGQIHALRKRLDQIPNGLEKLFQDILTKDTENMEYLVICLQWLLYAKRPLRLEEIYFGILSDSESNALAVWDFEDVTLEDINKFLLSSSKGLAELTKSEKQTVHFIHESVRNFLLEENGLAKIQSELLVNPTGLSHERLKRCCHNYLQIVKPELIRRVFPHDFASASRQPESFPFAEYAVNNILQHAEAAASHHVAQSAYMALFPRVHWIDTFNGLQRYKVRHYTSNASLLYILVEQVVPTLVESEVVQTGEVNIRGERFEYPLIAACMKCNEKIIDLLLSYRADVNVEDRDRNCPLHAAIDAGNKNVVELLIDRGANVHSTNKKGQSSLHAAARRANGDLVTLLLKHGAAVNAPDRHKECALHAALRASNETIVKLLLDNGADPNMKDKHGQWPLKVAFYQAADSGKDKMVRLLLDHYADANAQRGPNSDSLDTTSSSGHADSLVSLLANGSDVNAKYDPFGSALHIASSNGHANVVQLLLANGADINAKSELYGSALHTASDNGHADVVKLLIMKGADINAKCGVNGSAIQTACSSGHAAIVQLLLSNGADVNAQGVLHGSALQAACNHAHVGIARLLLRHGANVNAQGPLYGNALQAAAGSPENTTEVVQLLLNNGADVNASGGMYRSALRAASDEGHFDIVSLLLQAGADVNAKSEGYFSAAQVAHNNGYHEIVELLLRYGADVPVDHRWND